MVEVRYLRGEGLEGGRANDRIVLREGYARLLEQPTVYFPKKHYLRDKFFSLIR